MTVTVACVIVTRNQPPEAWQPYIPLLRWQRDSTLAHKEHSHIVVCDQNLPGFDCIVRGEDAEPLSLMKSIITSQLVALDAWNGKHPLVLVDADCLVLRDLHGAFDRFNGYWDVMLTNRSNPVAPINNGVMYVSPPNKKKIIAYFQKALSLCKDHWGGDQEAMGAAAAPIPMDYHGIVERAGLRINLVTMKYYAVVPETEGQRHKRGQYMAHFKGTNRKPWMATYAKMFLGLKEKHT